MNNPRHLNPSRAKRPGIAVQALRKPHGADHLRQLRRHRRRALQLITTGGSRYPTFISPVNIVNILQQVAVPGIIAVSA